MESLISTFHVDWKMLIAQIINFAIVFAVLYFFALRPLMKTVKERSAKIQKGLEDADTHESLLVETQEETARVVAEARTEALGLAQAAKKEAEERRAEMIEKANQDVAGIIEKGNQELQRQKDAMLAEARGEIAELVVTATRKIVGDHDAKVDATAVAKVLEDKK